MDESPFLATALAYLADCRRRGLRPATIRYYRMVLWAVAAAGRIDRLEELSLSRVRAFQDGATERLAPGSIRGFLRALKTFSRWATDEGLLATDPLARLKLPRADERVLIVPSDDELVALLEAAEPRLRVVIATLAGLGLRVGDLVGLDLADLRPGELAVRQTKNRQGRLIPLDPALERILALQTDQLRVSDHPALFSPEPAAA